MIKGNSLRVRKHPARLQRAAWALARVLLLSLTVMIDWLQRNSFSRSPASLIRFAQTQTAIVEHIFRCLLILMRATQAAPRPAPFQPALNDADARTPSARRLGAPGFLSLSQIAKGFARFGAAPPALDGRRRARPPALPPGAFGPTAAAPVADPLELLAARLSALRAVLADPHAHAARLAALLKAAGVSLRAALPQLPDAALWTLCNHAAKSLAIPTPGPLPDTS